MFTLKWWWFLKLLVIWGVTKQQHRFIPFQNYMCARNLCLLNNASDKNIKLGSLIGGKLVVFGQQQEKTCTLLKKI